MNRDLNLLIVDDEPNILVGLEHLLTRNRCNVTTASSIEEATKALEEAEFHILLTDYKLKDSDGIAFALKTLETFPHLYLLVMTAYGTVESAVDALKGGVYDYLTKPIDTARLLKRLEEIREIVTGDKGLENQPALNGDSSSMAAIRQLVKKASRSEATVLLTGETGTGKTFVARSIHDLSARAKGPFISVNCASIAPTLIESELFGHVKGAFTGADRSRPGKISQSHGGTLFLDEIGSTSLEFQAKLLTVIQDRTYEPVGSDRSVSVDVRFMAATNTDLQQAVRQGTFREDLYYRLKVLVCHLPPLRERREDIPRLCRHFLDAHRTGKSMKHLSTDTMAKLLSYSWPGNIRELKNILEVAADSSDGPELAPRDIPLDVKVISPADDSAEGLSSTISRIERAIIETALADSGGRVTDAAEALRMNERTLRRKIAALGIGRKDLGKSVP